MKNEIFEAIEKERKLAKLAVKQAISEKHMKDSIIYEQTESTESNDLIGTILEKYKLPCKKIDVGQQYEADELDSFFLGLPRFVESEIPVDNLGRQMRIMAQINCKEFVGLEGFPQSGILQIWVQSSNEVSMFSKTITKPCEIIYIANPDKNNIENVAIDESIYNNSCEDFPFVEKEDCKSNFTISFNVVTPSTPSAADAHMLSRLVQLETGNPDLKQIDFDDDRIQKSAWGSQVGGYPSFTQQGPGDRDTYDTLLLQIDSCKGFMIGDVGIMNFFINKEALMKKDFSDVFFYWDCH